MIGAASVEPPPVHSLTSDEPFLRWLLFESFAGLLSGIGALVCLYLALAGESSGGWLWVFLVLLITGLVCLVDIYRRVHNMRRGLYQAPSTGRAFSFWRLLSDLGGGDAGIGFGLLVAGLILVLLPLWLLASLIAYLAAGRKYRPIPSLDRRKYVR